LLLGLTGCGAEQNVKPDLPQSVSPGWKLASLDHSPVPPEIPATGSPDCWKAVYKGDGNPESTADMWVCHYTVEGGAFDAVQRTRAEAQSVKFQQGKYFVLVKWDATQKASLSALVRTIQKTLPAK
jgi:hypothetical protein